MFHRPLAGLFLILALALPVKADADFERQVVAPYVEVRTPAGCGSGVVLEVDGELLVLTAQHVTAGSKIAVLYKRHDDDQMDTRWLADVVAEGDARDPDQPDLALLRPRTPLGLTPAHFCSRLVAERGESAWVVGTHSGLHAQLEKTIVNRPRMTVDGRSYLVVNGNAWYGNSGGPVYVQRGADWYLAGVCVRLAALNPRTPVCCESVTAIRGFLDAWVASKAAKAEQVAYRPAPAADAKPDYSAHPLVGWWVLYWGNGPQVCRFDADGTYHCPKYGGRRWWPDAQNPDVVWFAEQPEWSKGEPAVYVISCNYEGEDSCGWGTIKDCDTGELKVGWKVEGVRLERIEALPVAPTRLP